MPSVAFLDVIKSLAKRYEEIVAYSVSSEKIRFKIAVQLGKLKEVEYLLCNQIVQYHAKTSVIDLFVTMRLHHSLKLNNRKFVSTNKVKRNRKTMKFSHV